MLQEKLEAWLSRAVPERAVNECFGLSTVLASDVGLERSENQDRVGALRLCSKDSSERPLIAVAVADGMGGMRDGAKCASLALSSFFHALSFQRSQEIEKRANAAIAHANTAVFRFAGGRGGATLSAVLLDQDLRPFVVHLGDSRVYSFGTDTTVERLTTDDSLAEAVGGSGRDLLQFVGMGEGMQPHVMPISPRIQRLGITTDGIHFLDPSVLESILAHANTLKSASERLSAIARWCGGPDNASSAMLDLQSLMKEIRNGSDNGLECWDPFGGLTVVWNKSDNLCNEQRQMNIDPYENSLAAEPRDSKSEVSAPERSKRRPRTKRSERNRKLSTPENDIQLEIQIERSSDPEDLDEDS